LREEIFQERLYKIYQAQLQLSRSAGLFHNIPENLRKKFQYSVWEPFLDLSDTLVDEIILQLDATCESQSTDKIALFRLGLYYAVVDAATPNFIRPGNHDRIKKCFDRLLHLLQTSSEPGDRANAIKIANLTQEILTRQHAQTPGCFDRWFIRRRVVLYACYNPESSDSQDSSHDEREYLLSRPRNRHRHYNSIASTAVDSKSWPSTSSQLINSSFRLPMATQVLEIKSDVVLPDEENYEALY
jgi:hypothetical protein